MNLDVFPRSLAGGSSVFAYFGIGKTARLVGLGVICIGLASCSSGPRKKAYSSAHINNKTKFSVKTFGVAASPRVTTSRRIRRGGGRAQIGKPYKVRGKWYRPREQPGYDKTGMASWYGPNFHGRLTANGEVYDQYALSGAHPTFPLPSYARVTNLANGNSVVVRVNDRGPYAHGRVIDMSAKAAELLDYKKKGIARVRVQYLGKARLDGRDQRFLLASFRPGAGYRPNRFDNSVPGVMIASNNRPPATIGPVPVLSFVNTPYPKERPVITGGIPVEIDPQQQSRLRNDVYQPVPRMETHYEAPQVHQPGTLEPMNPVVVKKLKKRFIISSYAAGQRISRAHQAAADIIVSPLIGKGDLQQHWKRINR